MRIQFIISIFILLLLGSFTVLNDSSNDVSQIRCSLEINMVNDSTYVIENYDQGYDLAANILLGTPSLSVSNDTIYSSGTIYSISIVVRDSSDCVQTQLITKQ